MSPLNWLVSEHGLFKFVDGGGGCLLSPLEKSSRVYSQMGRQKFEHCCLLKNLINAVEF